MDSVAQSVYETLDDVDALRSVASFAATERTVVFLREDVEPDFPETRQQDTLREALFQTMAAPILEEEFGGDLHTTTHVFDDKLVFIHRVDADADAGVFVSLDNSGDFAHREILRALEAATTQHRQ
ncbi:hypothetical protein [Halocalculus aciditolerans]|uniref:Uncharacterized protein n=1 Tax=Halocalculus aciditolerans TaxID=1383812 RepID=A0A830F0D3_9EURY|nr:hypothetical protein [Halocalculus aciditolerans]GGL50397.1 hypothetical protein GCM10009039_05690 [Halocalculus aciditolerans]